MLGWHRSHTLVEDYFPLVDRTSTASRRPDQTKEVRSVLYRSLRSRHIAETVKGVNKILSCYLRALR